MKKRICRILLPAVCLTFFCGDSHGQLYKELNLIGGYSDDMQWIGKSPGLKNSVGFEYYRKFSDEYGDFLTLDLQIRAAYDSMEDSGRAWGVEIHNAWLEYKLGLGKSLRIGHFDPAFGLEPVLDTHGTLLQTLSFENIGFKKDWGIAYKTLIGDYDFEIAGTLGSGMSIRYKDDSFLLTGRISKGKASQFQYGLSFLYGRVLESRESWTFPQAELASHESITKKRIGVDFQFPIGQVQFTAEAAAGTNDDTTVAGAMAQFEYVLPDRQDVTLKFQTMYWNDEWDNHDRTDLTLAPVVEWRVNQDLALRGGYFQDVASADDEEKRIMVQMYYYGI